MKQNFLRGLWVDNQYNVHLASSQGVDNQPFKSFAWLDYGNDSQRLKGSSDLQFLHQFSNDTDLKETVRYQNSLHIRGLENQYLLKNQLRLFQGMPFSALKRCQLDIETASSTGAFSNARLKGDRVLAIGLSMGDLSKNIVLQENSDEAESKLLCDLQQTLVDWDPDVIEGHNIFSFDLEYLRLRCKRHKLKPNWGRFNAEASFRKSRFKVAEHWVDYIRCDIPGRTVFDTYLMIQQYDVTKRELESYSLKNVALALGITQEDHNRTYIDGSNIQHIFNDDRDAFLAYLNDDLRETKGLADLLLPTYFAQTQNFPLTLQEICLRGSGTKVDTLFLEKYYAAGESLPGMSEGQVFAGGFTKSFETGVYKNVLHFDVASLYPSLLIAMGKNPRTDRLGCFIPMLKELRQYRLEYKKKAKSETDKDLQVEYEARQSAFKILINSFYGYLGFYGARFGDSELAAELTQKGRDLLVALIAKFKDLGCQVLEADTDGIYLSSEEYFNQPEALLNLVSEVMPDGVELEYDGKYEAMFSYKAKNYALREGDKVIIRGSAFRSRGIEPFLKELTDALIHDKLGFQSDVNSKIQSYLNAIESGQCDVKKLAKSERLSQNPDAYLKAVEGSKKPRRASLEVALKMSPQPKMGDKVQYFIAKGEKARMPDWQVAQPLDGHSIDLQPYNEKYYLKKLADWQKRYTEFL